MKSGAEAPANEEENKGRAACSTAGGSASHSSTRHTAPAAPWGEAGDDFEGEEGARDVADKGEQC